MIPVDFEGTNLVLNKPSDMTDEECSPIKAHAGVDAAGYPFILTAWMPNIDDVEAIKRGEPIYLKVIGSGFQPTAMFTLNEKGEANEEF